MAEPIRQPRTGTAERFTRFTGMPRGAVPPADTPSVPWVTRRVDAPGVSFHTFRSACVGGDVSYHRILPEAYTREPERRFPVVYWLHGSGGGLAGIGSVARRVRALQSAGGAPPFVVVLVNGLPEGMYVDWPDGGPPVESMIVRDLVPHIDATVRTIARRQGRMLDGFSMGGYGAARLGFKHFGMFHAVSILGAGPLDPDFNTTPRMGPRGREELLRRVYGNRDAFRAASPWALAERNAKEIRLGSLVRVAVGERDETVELNRKFHTHLEGLRIRHAWNVLPGVAHDPARTLAALGESDAKFHRAAFGGGTPGAPSRPDRVADIEVGGKRRRAIVVNAPAGSEPRPAVIVLHGGMGNADRMRAQSGFDPVARSHGFLVAYAEGTDLGGGRHAWNTGFLLRRALRGVDDIAYLDALIDVLVREHGADPERISLTGGSNGGMMTFAYGLARAERLAGIAPMVASMFTFDMKPTVPLPILMVNAVRDEEVPIAGGMSRNPLVRRTQDAPFKPLDDVVRFWVGVNGSDADPLVRRDGTVRTAAHPPSPTGAPTISMVDSVGGHGWPGAGSLRVGNTPIQGLRGAEVAWEFLGLQRREGAKAR